MVESPRNHGQRITRRILIKGTMLIAAGSALGATAENYGQQEVGILRNGIENNYGRFFPLYDNNSISADDIPSGLDIVFRDRALNKTDFDTLLKDPIKFLQDTHFQDGVLERWAQEKTRIAFGNISFGDFPGQDWIIPAGEAAFFLAGGLATKRRIGKFIFSFLTVFSMGRISDLVISGNPNKNPVTRTIIRAGGRMSALHPENRGIYLTDAKMAHAMMLSGFHVQLEMGRKPKVGINIGAEHNNVEEFLKPGQEFNAVRSAITDTNVLGTSYPIYSAEFLQDVVNKAGGLDNFCSAIEITLPPNFQMSQALNDPTRKKEIASQIKVRKYTPDNVLANQLKEKGVS